MNEPNPTNPEGRPAEPYPVQVGGPYIDQKLRDIVHGLTTGWAAEMLMEALADDYEARAKETGSLVSKDAALGAGIEVTSECGSFEGLGRL